MARKARIRWWIWLAMAGAIPALGLGIWFARKHQPAGTAPPTTASAQAPETFEMAEAIYDDGLKKGWEDRS